MHPNCLVTVLLAHDPLSSLDYPMITHTPLVAGNLPIKTLVARRWPTKNFINLQYLKCTCNQEINSQQLLHVPLLSYINMYVYMYVITYYHIGAYPQSHTAASRVNEDTCIYMYMYTYMYYRACWCAHTLLI